MDYAVINTNTSKIICICNIKQNAELIADILNTDDNVYAYSCGVCPNAKYKIVDAKYKIVKAEREDEE